MNTNNEKQILTESNSVPVNDSVVIIDKKINIFLTMIKIYTLFFAITVIFPFAFLLSLGPATKVAIWVFALFLLGVVFVAMCFLNLEKFWLIQISLNIGFLILFTHKELLVLAYAFSFVSSIPLGLIGLIFLYIFLKKNRSVFLQKIPGFIIVIGTIVYFIVINKIWRLIVEILV